MTTYGPIEAGAAGPGDDADDRVDASCEPSTILPADGEDTGLLAPPEVSPR